MRVKCPRVRIRSDGTTHNSQLPIPNWVPPCSKPTPSRALYYRRNPKFAGTDGKPHCAKFVTSNKSGLLGKTVCSSVVFWVSGEMKMTYKDPKIASSPLVSALWTLASQQTPHPFHWRLNCVPLLSLVRCLESRKTFAAPS